MPCTGRGIYSASMANVEADRFSEILEKFDRGRRHHIFPRKTRCSRSRRAASLAVWKMRHHSGLRSNFTVDETSFTIFQDILSNHCMVLNYPILYFRRRFSTIIMHTRILQLGSRILDAHEQHIQFRLHCRAKPIGFWLCSLVLTNDFLRRPMIVVQLNWRDNQG